jgi:hypothetical protein
MVVDKICGQLCMKAMEKMLRSSLSGDIIRIEIKPNLARGWVTVSADFLFSLTDLPECSPQGDRP